VTIFNLDQTSGSLQTVKITGSDNEVMASADVVHLSASMSDSRPVMWTYVYPGTSLNNLFSNHLTLFSSGAPGQCGVHHGKN